MLEENQRASLRSSSPKIESRISAEVLCLFVPRLFSFFVSIHISYILAAPPFCYL